MDRDVILCEMGLHLKLQYGRDPADSAFEFDGPRFPRTPIELTVSSHRGISALASFKYIGATRRLTRAASILQAGLSRRSSRRSATRPIQKQRHEQQQANF